MRELGLIKDAEMKHHTTKKSGRRVIPKERIEIWKALIVMSVNMFQGTHSTLKGKSRNRVSFLRLFEDFPVFQEWEELGAAFFYDSLKNTTNLKAFQNEIEKKFEIAQTNPANCSYKPGQIVNAASIWNTGDRSLKKWVDLSIGVEAAQMQGQEVLEYFSNFLKYTLAHGEIPDMKFPGGVPSAKYWFGGMKGIAKSTECSCVALMTAPAWSLYGKAFKKIKTAVFGKAKVPTSVDEAVGEVIAAAKQASHVQRLATKSNAYSRGVLWEPAAYFANECGSEELKDVEFSKQTKSDESIVKQITGAYAVSFFVRFSSDYLSDFCAGKRKCSSRISVDCVSYELTAVRHVRNDRATICASRG